MLGRNQKSFNYPFASCMFFAHLFTILCASKCTKSIYCFPAGCPKSADTKSTPSKILEPINMSIRGHPFLYIWTNLGTISNLWANLGPILVKLIFRTYFTPPPYPKKEQSLVILISDRYCHDRSNNYIIIQRYVGQRF